ncbi:hypothetical protein ACOT81_21890 [Streptomyces sp. WI04-05B]|uniref:hypothetical protein n=1 Tax=Streptomyces TaxID=1883 RepID=UPI0029A5E8A0|nr:MULTISPECIES: hypothetical protein [unclassified Streptomyces]MDX2543273.1 hypothetical protein [Streptomyces sp. WI04-05B]MDX2584686.1 hypothetical protein [Streptomyces sp. WI04-05A]MDX3752807.1 hypothetical protein [Streptomyces sp. AK08-02]
MLDTAPLQAQFLDHVEYFARWSGLAIGIVVAQQLIEINSGDIAMPLVFAITAFGLCAVGGVLLGDALTLRPQEAVRTASLAPRLVRDQVPPRMAPLLLLQAASLVALLVIGAFTASDPTRADRAGRVLTITCEGMRTSMGPWPGLYYSGPMFAALAVGTPVCVWALRRIAHGQGDDQQRRDRAWAITGAWGLLVSSQVLLVALMIFVALTEEACAGPLGAAAIMAVSPLSLLGLFTFGWSLVTVVAPRAVDDEPADEGAFTDE